MTVDLDPRDVAAEERSQLMIDADNEERSYRSGWCGTTASHESHQRCSGVTQDGKGALRCHCLCHIKPTDKEGPGAAPDAARQDEVQAMPDQQIKGGTDIKEGLHFDLPNADYHAQTDWWSSTQLKRQLPERYDEASMSQAALDFGTLVHSVVLEPDNLGMYVAADAEKIGVKADGGKADKPESTKAWKSFVAEARSDGKTIVTQADWDRAHRMRDSIIAHPEARELLFSDDGESEVSAFATDENGIRHKARFDRLIPGAGVDLKSTGARPGEDSLNRVVINFLYDLSAFHYLTVAELLDLGVETFTWVFVSKTEPYRVTVADAGRGYIDRGRLLRNLALARAADELESYEGATRRLVLEPPPWARLSPATTGIPADFEWSLNAYQDA